MATAKPAAPSLPLRPDAGGKTGQPIKVKVNHFKTVLPRNLELIHYDVEITPDVSKKIKRQVVKTMIDHYVKGKSI